MWFLAIAAGIVIAIVAGGSWPDPRAAQAT
jgi:hypothetical protein